MDVTHASIIVVDGVRQKCHQEWRRFCDSACGVRGNTETGCFPGIWERVPVSWTDGRESIADRQTDAVSGPPPQT